MSIFMVISLPEVTAPSPEPGQSPQPMVPIKEAIERAFPGDTFVLGPQQWLVSAEGTAQDVYVKLTGNEQNTVGGVLVASMFGYWGLAQTNLWEWIATKSAPKAAVTASPTSAQVSAAAASR